MVESPTYFHSLSPILQSLKQFDMESFPLQEEVIYAKPVQELPGYLKKATFDTSVVCSPKKAGIIHERQGDKPDEGKNSSKTEANEGKNLQEMKRNDCVSSGDAMLIDDFYEFVELPSDPPCDEEINTECNFSEKLPLEVQNTKPVLEVYKESTTISKQIGNVERTFPNDKSEERMDIDPIAENNLHSKCLSKEKQGKGKHGGRMNVESFLEIFNSSLQSSLDASQCDALTHALKNKLAVIQGEH